MNNYNINIEYNFFSESDINRLTEWFIDLIYQGQNIAKSNAPILSWNLRRSIVTNIKTTLNNNLIWQIWSKLKYAKRREFENKKHPNRKYYMKKAKNYIENNIWNIFEQHLNNLIRNNNEL